MEDKKPNPIAQQSGKIAKVAIERDGAAAAEEVRALQYAKRAANQRNEATKRHGALQQALF